MYVTIEPLENPKFAGWCEMAIRGDSFGSLSVPCKSREKAITEARSVLASRVARSRSLEEQHRYLEMIRTLDGIGRKEDHAILA